MKREHIGSDLDGFLKRDGLLAECEAGALKRLPKILSFHFDNSAHFVQPGAHAVSDAIAESLTAGGALGAGVPGVGVVKKRLADEWPVISSERTRNSASLGLEFNP